MDVNQSHVRGDAVARIQKHDIAGYEFDRVDAPAHSFPHCHDALRKQIAKTLASFLRAILLNECEQAINYDNYEDRESELWHASQNGQTAGNPQHDCKKMHDLG
jgi:hypothetical protein